MKFNYGNCSALKKWNEDLHKQFSDLDESEVTLCSIKIRYSALFLFISSNLQVSRLPFTRTFGHKEEFLSVNTPCISIPVYLELEPR